MTFEQMLRRAKDGDHEAITSILLMYRPLLLKYAVINGRLDGMESRMEGIESRLDKLEEHAEVTRAGVNSLLEWAEECGNVIKFPLPKVK